MKRDMDLVRKILLQMEEYDRIGPFGDFRVENYDANVVGYHLLLMNEAGLLIAKDAHSRENPTGAMPVRLTWSGHEFLDIGRNEERWNTAKGMAAKLGNVSLEVLTNLLVRLANEQIGRLFLTGPP